MRGEYLVRDKLRKAGFVVDRVPVSGASQGFKGDLRVKFDSKEILVEVKLRKDEFSYLYDSIPLIEGMVAFCDGCMMSYDPAPIVGSSKIRRSAWLAYTPKMAKLLRKLWVLRGNSDILVVKDDRKDPIYISWISESAFEEVVGSG